MRKITLTLFALLSVVMAFSQTEEAFWHPPVEMSNHVILGWDGQIDSTIIERDLDAIEVSVASSSSLATTWANHISVSSGLPTYGLWQMPWNVVA